MNLDVHEFLQSNLNKSSTILLPLYPQILGLISNWWVFFILPLKSSHNLYFCPFYDEITVWDVYERCV